MFRIVGMRAGRKVMMISSTETPRIETCSHFGSLVGIVSDTSHCVTSFSNVPNEADALNDETRFIFWYR